MFKMMAVTSLLLISIFAPTAYAVELDESPTSAPSDDAELVEADNTEATNSASTPMIFPWEAALGLSVLTFPNDNCADCEYHCESEYNDCLVNCTATGGGQPGTNEAKCMRGCERFCQSCQAECFWNFQNCGGAC